jgi:hypothetical protein
MDTHPDNLSELERRLAACGPATAGLDADAMLFAAGRASVRPGRMRFIWPSVSAGLAVLAAALGVWLAAERSERLLLAEHLRRPAPAPSLPSAPPQPHTADEPAPNSLLSAHRALEKGLDAWPPLATPDLPPGPPPADPPVLRVGRYATLPDF